MAWRLAIDFGTSNTAAAIQSNGIVRPVSLSDSSVSMPSAIVLTPTGYRVGDEAINAQLRHPDGFERTPKMLIGRNEAVLAGKIIKPEEIAREIYSYVRAAALRRQNNEPPAEVWLTHPVAWAPSQIETLRKAAEAAGFAPETIRTVNEPIAAAAHYARNHQTVPGSRVSVFDFGGGTLDIAVLERAPQEPQGYRVLAFGGDPVLGGRTFDARLLDWTLDTLRSLGHESLAERLHQPKTMAELRAQTSLSRAVTAAKTELSTRPDADISVSLGDEDAVVTITRKEYEGLIDEDLDRAGKLLEEVFETVSGPRAEVMYLTGGSSRTPAISDMIRERTGIRIATLDDPKLVVAEGALYVAPLGDARAAAAPGAPQQPPAGGPLNGPQGPGGPGQFAPQPFVGQTPGAPAPARFQPQQQPMAQGPQPRPMNQGPQPRPMNQGPQPRPMDQGPQPRPMDQTGQMPQPRPMNQTGQMPQPRPMNGGPDRGEQRGPNAPQQPPTKQMGSLSRPPRDADRRPSPDRPPQPAEQDRRPQQYTPAQQSAPRKKKRAGLWIVLAIVGVLVIGGGIWGGIVLFGGKDSGGQQQQQQAELPSVPDGEIDCWDGTRADAGAACPELTGEAGLSWVTKVNGAGCGTVDMGVKESVQCSWYDRTDTSIYLMEFDSADAALESGQKAYDKESDWEIDGEHAGTQFEGEFEDNGGGYSYYFVYDNLPYAIYLVTQNGSDGKHDDLSAVESRFTPKSLEDVAYAYATTQR